MSSWTTFDEKNLTLEFAPTFSVVAKTYEVKITVTDDDFWESGSTMSETGRIGITVTPMEFDCHENAFYEDIYVEVNEDGQVLLQGYSEDNGCSDVSFSFELTDVGSLPSFMSESGSKFKVNPRTNEEQGSYIVQPSVVCLEETYSIPYFYVFIVPEGSSEMINSIEAGISSDLSLEIAKIS